MVSPKRAWRFLLLLLIWEDGLSSLFDVYFSEVYVDVLAELLKVKTEMLWVAMVKQEKNSSLELV